MTNKSSFTRRDVIKAGAGAAAATLAAPVVAGHLAPTPPNPEGPFYPIKDQVDKDADLTQVAGRSGQAKGQVVHVSGIVVDEDGNPVEGAVVDIWQANAAGRYDHEGDTSETPRDPDFQGWGIMKTGADGQYAFKTVKPGAYTAMGEWVRPPHIHFKVSRRGYHELTTQMYWDGDPLNDKDELFQAVPEEERKHLLVAFDESGEVPEGQFNIVLGKVGAA